MKGEPSLVTLPRIGQTLRLSLVSLDEEKSKHTFRSRVADLQSDVVAIEIPINEKTGRSVPFYVGEEYDAWYIGEDGSRFSFRTEILGKRTDNIPVLLIKMPAKDEVTRTQRRNYLRVDMNVEIAVKLEDNVRNYHFLARTVDLSGGGLSFTCPDDLRWKEQDKVNIWICLPSKTGAVAHAFAAAEIIRCKPPEQPGTHQWVSVKFIQVNESDQAKIVRACFERQFELRKKGVFE